MADRNSYFPLADKEKERQRLSGMTVIERLVLTGQLEAYEKAENAKDTSTLERILKSVFVDDISANEILKRFRS